MDSGNSTPADGNAPALPTTLGGAVADIFRHPVQRLVRNWNWKAGLLSAFLRTSIFFTVNLTASWDSAIHAAGTELLYRAPMVGTLAALSQSFRRVQPAWIASAVMMIVLPVTAHGIEFTVHWLRGTDKLAESVAASVGFSMITSLLNYLLHRRDVLIVGDGASPFFADVVQAPVHLFDLLLRWPVRLIRAASAGAAASRDEP